MISEENKKRCDLIRDNCMSLSCAERIRVKWAVKEIIGCDLSEMGDWSPVSNELEIEE